MTKLVISCDSGAHSLYKMKFAPSRARGKGAMEFRSYDFVRSADFTKYLDSYLEYCHLNKRKFGCYVALDIIFEGDESWAVYEIMRKEGLDPVPVYHYGEDITHLWRYMDTTDYIGIGGVGQDITIPKFITWADEVFRNICGRDGKPRWKTHGFAMTGTELMKAYPWYSVDSSSWTTLSRNGWVMMPKFSTPAVREHKNKYQRLPWEDIKLRWLHRGLGLRFPPRSSNAAAYFHKQNGAYKATAEYYLEKMFGYKAQDFEEYLPRDVANASYFANVSYELKKLYKEKYGFEEGGNLYLAGKNSFGMGDIDEVMSCWKQVASACPHVEYLNYLGTYYYPQDLAAMLTIQKMLKENKGDF